MASVHDVAAYILEVTGEISAMKLQKLCYYSQAWSLVWDDAGLFPEPIEAWANGPVIPVLYAAHRGMFKVKPPWTDGDTTRLSAQQRESVDAVLQYYGDKSPDWLSQLTHKERPWRDARKGLAPDERGNQVISDASMAEYYGGLAG